MRHRKNVVKLGRMSSHRNAMFANMAVSLLVHKRIQTTLPKAKALVFLLHKLITWSKVDSLHHRRLAFRILKDRSLVKMLFTDIGPAMAGRNGGYTRIIKSGIRPGDGAPMAIIELLGYEIKEEKEGKKEKKKEKTEKKEEKVKEKKTKEK